MHCIVYSEKRLIYQLLVLHIAYFFVHSWASWLYLGRSVLYIRAMSGTRGSSGLGSQRRLQIDSKTRVGRKLLRAMIIGDIYKYRHNKGIVWYNSCMYVYISKV